MTIHISANSRTWAGLDTPRPGPKPHPTRWFLRRGFDGTISLVLHENNRVERIHWPASIQYNAIMRRTMRGALHLLREKIKLAEKR